MSDAFDLDRIYCFIREHFRDEAKQSTDRFGFGGDWQQVQAESFTASHRRVEPRVAAWRSVF